MKYSDKFRLRIIYCVSFITDVEPAVKEVDKATDQSCSLQRCTLKSQSSSENSSGIVLTTDIIAD